MASPSLLRVGFRDGPERHSQHPAIEAELIALYLIKPRIISLTRADPLFFLPTASPLPSFTIFHLHLPREQPSLSLSLLTSIRGSFTENFLHIRRSFVFLPPHPENPFVM